MNNQDIIALVALLVGIVSAVCAFIFWLVNISYKMTNFIFGIKSDINDIKRTVHDSKGVVFRLRQEIKYLKYVIKREFPQYFKREEDEEDDTPSN